MKGVARFDFDRSTANAEDGIKLATERRPDLILMDIQLPGMNGIEALKVLRAEPQTAKIPVIAVTASVMTQDRARIMAAGFNGFQSKPISVNQLLATVRDALDKILGSHLPFPAVVVDRHWNLVSANETALAILSDGVAPDLLGPHANTLRVCLHPEGLAPRIVNLAEYSAHLIERLDRLAAASADPEILSLRDELLRFPGVSAGHSGGSDTAARLFVPLVLRGDDGELTFFSTIATFGTAHDITVAELAIEAFFPADERTGAALRGT